MIRGLKELPIYHIYMNIDWNVWKR